MGEMRMDKERSSENPEEDCRINVKLHSCSTSALDGGGVSGQLQALADLPTGKNPRAYCAGG